MLEFSALKFYKIGAALERIIELANEYNPEEKIGLIKPFSELADDISQQCSRIGLTQSAHLAKRLSRILTPECLIATLKADIESLDSVVRNELKSEFFLWVSTEQASYYKKAPEDLLGRECLDRFFDSGIEQEAAEAMRCYALDRSTACAFHLMRMTEAGLRAFATAIGYQPQRGNWNWGEVFKEYDRQFRLDPKSRPAHWQSHGDFLEEISGDLRAVQKAWRNHVSHLDKSYTEPQAEYLLRVIPVFIRHLSTRLDENGILYPATT
jgi:hypothetical protein